MANTVIFIGKQKVLYISIYYKLYKFMQKEVRPMGTVPVGKSGVLQMETNVIHYPNLKTVLMVEDTLKNSNKPITREQLKKKLPTQIMHQTLNVILEYLEKSGKILDGRKGIVWIYNESPKLKKAIEEGISV